MRLRIRLSSLLLFNFIFFLTSVVAHGAACCGGGFAAPSVIVGDDKAQATVSYSYSQIIDDVGADALWRPRDAIESTETLKIETAHIFWDRWQAGLSLPVVRRARAGEASTGLGDTAATAGYEYLPDWDYNPWRPRGLGFFQLTLPTGKSVDESDTTYQLDSRGRGFWAVGIGTVLTKAIRNWDGVISFDLHKSFSKSYQNSQSQGTLNPGLGGNLAVGAGYNLTSVRLGAALTWTYEDPVQVRGTIDSSGSLQRYATANLSVSYLFSAKWAEGWATTLTYADQTLFGAPVNTSLGRGASVFLQKRWAR